MLRSIALGLCLVGIFGCSTPSPTARIQREPELYASFPPEARELIARGEIRPGFSRPMVRMAWGTPNRVGTEVGEAGGREFWIYTRTRTHTAVSHPVGPVYDPRTPHGRRTSRPRLMQVREPEERARVVFVEERVSTFRRVSENIP